MPTYNFVNDKTGDEWEEMMSMAEREQCLEDNPHIRTVITQINIVRGVEGQHKTDGGFNEMLQRTADAHPGSPLAEKYGDKGIKASRTRTAVDKWKKKRAADPNK
jgi:hypothetical protein